MSLKKVFPFAFLATMALSACGGDDKDDDDDVTGPTGDTPTQAQVAAMTQALASIASVFPIGVFGPGGVAAQTVSFPNETSPCPNGGTVTTGGNYTMSGNGQTNVTYSYTLTNSFSQCKATGNNTLFTFNGQGLTLSGSVKYVAQPFSYNYDLTEKGNLSWSGDGKSGTCAVDLHIKLNYTASGTYTYDYSGSYCGVSVTL